MGVICTNVLEEIHRLLVNVPDWRNMHNDIGLAMACNPSTDAMNILPVRD